MSKPGVDDRAFTLSPSREEEIRSAVRIATSSGPLFDSQVVTDLLGEVDRLRAKLQQAAVARDLAGRAASTLRDACDDITPRAMRFRKGPKDASE